jgi:hypothetical protein
MFNERSRGFVHKVKERYEDQPDKYKLFISILRSVGSSSLQETCAQVEILFHDAPELLEEFEELVRVEFLNKEPSLPKLPTVAQAGPSTTRIRNENNTPDRASLEGAVKPETVLLGSLLDKEGNGRTESRSRSKSVVGGQRKLKALSTVLPSRAFSFLCGGAGNTGDSVESRPMARKRSTSLCAEGNISFDA